MWDADWVDLHVQLDHLPREARLVCTLYGMTASQVGAFLFFLSFSSSFSPFLVVVVVVVLFLLFLLLLSLSLSLSVCVCVCVCCSSVVVLINLWG